MFVAREARLSSNPGVNRFHLHIISFITWWFNLFWYLFIATYTHYIIKFNNLDYLELNFENVRGPAWLSGGSVWSQSKLKFRWGQIK